MPDLPRLSKVLQGGSDDLPEKVVQFGSGRFVRGFIEYFIDRANRQGLFGGRVVVVQSTGSGRSNTLDEQDGLYTLVVQGLEDGQPVQTHAVISSISRAIPANEDWEAVLACARDPEIICVISNTTEVGIVLDETDRPDMNPPRSFPGKLTAFLHERAQAFSFAPESGVAVLPCELIEQNGDVLRGIVLDLARQWGLGEAFIAWISEHCPFCNALVDRIVTGTPAEPVLHRHWDELGYVDDLLTITEVYRLWAVQGDEDLKRRLPFLSADPGIVVAADITPYRDLKVRILNGTHTVMVPLSFLAGNETVLQSMQDPLVSDFIRGVMLEEIVPSLDLPEAQAAAFARDVLDRFGNPFLEHLLLNITFQSTTKVRHRVVPSLLGSYRKEQRLPRRILLGFAAYLLFMRGVVKEDGTVYGERGGERYPINDDHASFFLERWRDVDPSDESQVRGLVEGVCADGSLWG
ncbi:MAG TPA: tagaturonate reductase, partial [Rhodothermales bacterium]|nr:tagaturonate reductase [Rhodothermales bacterium]